MKNTRSLGLFAFSKHFPKMIAGLQPPSVTPNPIHGAPVVLMEQGLAPGAAGGGSSELTMMSLRDLIAENIELYQFCCLTGIIRPSPTDNVGSLSKINLRYRAWVTYLHIAFFLNCIVMLAYGIYALVLIHEDRDNAISASEAFNILLQNLLVIPPVVYLRRELTTTREVNRHHYQEAFRYGMDIGKRVFKVLVVFLVVLTVDLVSYETWPTWLYEALLILLTFLPANAFLTGVFTFLVVELHITYQIIRETEQKVVARTLEHTEYLTTLKAIVQRERLYPINWLTSAAVLNTVLGMILMVIAQPNASKQWMCLQGVCIF